jgi:F420-dependent oxidoreductase-like protein
MARFAIKTQPHHARWSDILEVWREADQIELFESAWTFDHFYPISGDPTGPCLEAWVTLSALAQATSRLRIGCMVHGMHFRHPAVTANMAAALDIVSGGRLNLGLGAGWYELEAEAYGLRLGSLSERMDRFDEGVEVIARLLSQETTSFEGRHFHLQEARCEPKGPQRPRPPIVIGGKGEKRTLRTVARWADMWDCVQIEPDAWGRKDQVLRAHCDEVGRDPAEITRSVHVLWSAHDEPAALADRAGRFFEAGADVAVFSMLAPFQASMVAPLASALSEL